MNFDSKTLEKIYNDAVALFDSEFDIWCREMLEKTNGDYLNLTLEICELLSEKFHVSKEKLKPLLIYNSEDNIEKIIMENSNSGNYRCRKEKSISEGYSAWILRKNGEHREMKIYYDNNTHCINCLSLDNGWSSIGATISYRTLNSFIVAWAANDM